MLSDTNPNAVICADELTVPSGIFSPLSDTNPNAVICADDDIVPSGVGVPVDVIVIPPLPDVTVILSPPINAGIPVILSYVICSEPLTIPSGMFDNPK